MPPARCEKFKIYSILKEICIFAVAPLIFLSATIGYAAEQNPTPCKEIKNYLSEIKVKPKKPTSFAQIIADMEKPHPEPPMGGGVGWSEKPTIIMGTEPYSTSLPRNWKGIPVPNWHALTPWYVVYPSLVKTLAKNSAVQIGKIDLWYLSRITGSWQLIVTSENPTWQGNYDDSGKWTKSGNLSPGLQYCEGIASPDFGQHTHGGLGKYQTPWNDKSGQADIDALLVIVWHRLIRINFNEPADNPQARFVVMAGADFYPDVSSKLADLNAPYVPGVGLGQFKVSEYEWKASSMIVWSAKYRDKGIVKPKPDSPDIIP